MSMTQCLHVSISRCFRVSASMPPCLRVSVSPCFRVSMTLSPYFRIPLMENGNFCLFAANGKRKRQTSVCLHAIGIRKRKNFCPWSANGNKRLLFQQTWPSKHAHEYILYMSKCSIKALKNYKRSEKRTQSIVFIGSHQRHMIITRVGHIVNRTGLQISFYEDMSPFFLDLLVFYI